MTQTFRSTLEDIDQHVQSLEWTTDTGHVLHGVLHHKDGRIALNVNSKRVTETVNFEYIYRDDLMGNRRILHPYNLQSYKHIPHTEMSETWPVEIFMIIDEYRSPAHLQGSNEVTFDYDSFIWEFLPKNPEEEKKLCELLADLKDIKTSVGSISVDLPIYENSSKHPSVVEKRMDKIAVTINPSEPLSNEDILMWNAKLGQLLTLIHKEHVIVTAIHRGFDSITVPELIEDYKEAGYAFRMPISLDEFVEVIREALPTFIDKYNEIATFTEDLAQYYYDYSLAPPDSIQLLRLFTSLEQCANYAQKKEKILVTQLDAEQTKRKEEFKVLLDKVKNDEEIAKPVYDYLLNKTQGYYTSSGSLSAPKHKVKALAELLRDEYGTYNSLISLSNVEVVLKMRNIVAHGFFDLGSRDHFYANRDKLGQDIEQCIRMYIFRALGCSAKTVTRHKDPLKAHQFNSY